MGTGWRVNRMLDFSRVMFLSTPASSRTRVPQLPTRSRNKPFAKWKKPSDGL
jgi:hypothetical protein